MKVACPECGREYRFSKSMVGKKLTCLCGYDFIFGEIRYPTMEESRLAYALNCLKNDEDVVRLSVSGTPCPACAKYENRLFSLTGKTKGLPTWEELKRDGVFHAGCTHCFMAVGELTRIEDYYPDGFPKKGLNAPARRRKYIPDSVICPRCGKSFPFNHRMIGEELICTCKHRFYLPECKPGIVFRLFTPRRAGCCALLLLLIGGGMAAGGNWTALGGYLLITLAVSGFPALMIYRLISKFRMKKKFK